MSTDAPAPHQRVCEAPGCKLAGEYRAPRARDRLNEYRWFCREHVRDYNKKWDYFRGLDADEIEKHIRADTTWRRPVWPLGGRRTGGAPLPAVQAGLPAWSRRQTCFYRHLPARDPIP